MEHLWIEIYTFGDCLSILTFTSTGVAEALGFEPDEVLTLGRAVAGLKAHSQGISLGQFY